MKLGITGLLPSTIHEIDAAAIRRVRKMGFSGTALPGNEPPETISTEQARGLGRLFEGEGIEVVEYGHYQTSFVDPDPAVQAAHIATVREAARVARVVGCPVVVAGIGSLSPAGHWFAHPDNFTSATRERLIAALSEAARAAEDQGVILALECHVTTTLRNAQIAREVLDAVGSPSLQVHLDPVNWMTFETLFESGAAISEMFASLGSSGISGAHSKGVMFEDRLIVHMNETYTGAPDDLLDHATFLKELATMPDDPYLVIEHLTVEKMPLARAHLLSVAESLGLTFSGAET